MLGSSFGRLHTLVPLGVGRCGVGGLASMSATMWIPMAQGYADVERLFMEAMDMVDMVVALEDVVGLEDEGDLEAALVKDPNIGEYYSSRD